MSMSVHVAKADGRGLPGDGPTVQAKSAQGAANTQVTVTVPAAAGRRTHITGILCGYRGGAANQAATLTYGTNTVYIPVTDTEPAHLAFSRPLEIGEQDVTVTLPAGGTGVIGVVTILYMQL